MTHQEKLIEDIKGMIVEKTIVPASIAATDKQEDAVYDQLALDILAVFEKAQGEPSDAQVNAERAYAAALYPHISWERLTNLTRHEIEVGVAAALRAAGDAR